MSFSGQAIDIFQGRDVNLAGASWTAKVQPDDSLSLTVAVTSDDRSLVRNSLREDMNHEVMERKADVGAITRQIDAYVLQIEEVTFVWVWRLYRGIVFFNDGVWVGLCLLC
jgi:hypothetical protein